MLFVFSQEDHPRIVSIYQEKYYLYYSIAASITEKCVPVDDIVQSAFLDLIAAYDRHRQMPRDEMERYLMGIVKHKALKAVRQRNKTICLEPAVAEEGDDSVFLRMEQRCDEENVRAALALLPERTAEYLVLRYVHQMEDQAIAEIMEVGVKSVPVLRHRAKQALKKALLQIENGGETHAG